MKCLKQIREILSDTHSLSSFQVKYDGFDYVFTSTSGETIEIAKAHIWQAARIGDSILSLVLDATLNANYYEDE